MFHFLYQRLFSAVIVKHFHFQLVSWKRTHLEGKRAIRSSMNFAISRKLICFAISVTFRSPFRVQFWVHFLGSVSVNLTLLKHFSLTSPSEPFRIRFYSFSLKAQMNRNNSIYFGWNIQKLKSRWIMRFECREQQDEGVCTWRRRIPRFLL